MHGDGMEYDMKKMRTQLMNNIARNLSNTVIFSFKAQGHHWNVKGMKFHMFHEFFGEIYEDVQDSIDPMAENLLKLGSHAPHNLVEFAKYSALEDSPECKNVQMMLEDLSRANQVFIEDLNQGIELAGKCREYGIADFLGVRVDMQKKWQWQITAHLTDNDKDKY
jgi:starvation-inducible DNA-binding protein